jgi:hypothetical protein
MQDLHRQEELSNIVALGLHSEEIVLAVGRLSRGASRPTDKPIVEACATILRALSDAGSPFAPISTGVGFMSADGYIDTLRVVRAQAPDVSAQEYAASLADALTKAVEQPNDVSDVDRESLQRVRELFGAVGRGSIARANDLSQPPQD